MTHVVVMGVSGAGKSTVGWHLAAALGLPYLEGDDLHSAVAVAKMARGEPLTDADRGPWLDAIGAWLAARPGGAVASCSALKRAYRDQLRGHVGDLFCLHLTVDEATLRARVTQRSGHFMPASLVGSQLDILEPLGDDEAGLTLDGATPATETVTCAVRALG